MWSRDEGLVWCQDRSGDEKIRPWSWSRSLGLGLVLKFYHHKVIGILVWFSSVLQSLSRVLCVTVFHTERALC